MEMHQVLSIPISGLAAIELPSGIHSDSERQPHGLNLCSWMDLSEFIQFARHEVPGAETQPEKTTVSLSVTFYGFVG